MPVTSLPVMHAPFVSPLRIFRLIGSQLKRVPEEALPMDRNGRERLLPGWPRDEKGRPKPAVMQKDVFKLLGIPYLHEWEREAG